MNVSLVKRTMRKKCRQNEMKERGNEMDLCQLKAKQESFSGREGKDGKVERTMRILKKIKEAGEGES